MNPLIRDAIRQTPVEIQALKTELTSVKNTISEMRKLLETIDRRVRGKQSQEK